MGKVVLGGADPALSGFVAVGLAAHETTATTRRATGRLLRARKHNKTCPWVGVSTTACRVTC